MGETRERAHVGNYVVSGDTIGIRYMQAMSAHEQRMLFDHASEGGEIHFSDGKQNYSLRRNPDYTFALSLGESHRHQHFPG